MRVYETWQCPNCERTEHFDVDRYLTEGHPMCVLCGAYIEMEKLSDERIIVE